MKCSKCWLFTYKQLFIVSTKLFLIRDNILKVTMTHASFICRIISFLESVILTLFFFIYPLKNSSGVRLSKRGGH